MKLSEASEVELVNVHQLLSYSENEDININYKEFLPRSRMHLPDVTIGETVASGELSLEEFKHYLKQRKRIEVERRFQDICSRQRKLGIGDWICYQNTEATNEQIADTNGGLLGKFVGVYRVKHLDVSKYTTTTRYEYGLRLRDLKDNPVNLPLKLVVIGSNNDICSIQYYDPASVDLTGKVLGRVPLVHLTFAGHCARDKYFDLYFGAYLSHLSVKDSLFRPLVDYNIDSSSDTLATPVAMLKHCEDALTYLNTVHYVRTLFGSILEDFPNTSRLVAYS